VPPRSAADGVGHAPRVEPRAVHSREAMAGPTDRAARGAGNGPQECAASCARTVGTFGERLRAYGSPRTACSIGSRVFDAAAALSKCAAPARVRRLPRCFLRRTVPRDA
jgi:hypothetical protein